MMEATTNSSDTKKKNEYFLDKSIKWAKQREDDTAVVYVHRNCTQSTLVTSQGGIN